MSSSYLSVYNIRFQINDKSMDTIKVNIDVEACTISVYNNGCGIPIEIHS